jgi:excisionase family DNA binding protein
MPKASADPPKADRYGYPPRGLDHDAAARYVGVDPAAFDDLLHLGKLPGPRQVGPALICDREELDAAFALFPSATAAKVRWVLPSAEFEGHPNVYTPDTLAERWRCSGQHVRNMIRRGDLEAWKIQGKLLRISVKTVVALEAREF